MRDAVAITGSHHGERATGPRGHEEEGSWVQQERPDEDPRQLDGCHQGRREREHVGDVGVRCGEEVNPSGDDAAGSDSRRERVVPGARLRAGIAEPGAAAVPDPHARDGDAIALCLGWHAQQEAQRGPEDGARSSGRQRLDIRLAEIEDAGEDIEPLQAPGHGLQRNRLQRAAFDALLAGGDEASLQASLRARALLPSGAAGRRALAAIVREVRPYADAFAHWRRDAESASLPVEVDIDGLRLHGRIGDAWPQGIARLRFGKPNGPSSIRNGLDWLLARAAGVGMPFVEFHETKDAGIGPHERVELDPTQAKDALRVLLALRSTGLSHPLVFAPRSGWKFYSAKTIKAGVRDAGNQWHGGEKQWAEAGTPAYELALRGIDPFADRGILRRFVGTTNAIYAAVCSGISVPPTIDDDAISRIELREDDDAESDE